MNLALVQKLVKIFARGNFKNNFLSILLFLAFFILLLFFAVLKKLCLLPTYFSSSFPMFYSFISFSHFSSFPLNAFTNATPRVLSQNKLDQHLVFDLDKGTMQRVPLYGSIYKFAYYFIDILVGIPPQRQSVIIDTGSSLLAFPCAKCKHCGKHVDDFFKPEKSHTGRYINCNDYHCYGTCLNDKCIYFQKYSEGSMISGAYVSDYIAIGNFEQKNPPVRYNYIGCHDTETNLFLTQYASGIFGISFPKNRKQDTAIDAFFNLKKSQNKIVHDLFFSSLFNKSATNLLSNIDQGVSTTSFMESEEESSNEDLFPSKIFSVCIADNGGLFTVGGYETSIIIPNSKNSTEIKWIPIMSHTSYKVRLVAIKIDNYVIAEGLPSPLRNKDSSSELTEIIHYGDSILDSGTTFTYFPSAIFKVISHVFDKLCTEANKCKVTTDYRKCWKGQKNFDIILELFPVIKLFFDCGSKIQEIAWHPASYLYMRPDDWLCETIDENNLKESVLGMSFFKRKQIIFNRQENLIGVVESNCPEYFVEDRPMCPNEIVENIFEDDNKDKNTTETKHENITESAMPYTSASFSLPSSDNKVDDNFYHLAICWSCAILLAMIFMSLTVMIYQSISSNFSYKILSSLPYRPNKANYMKIEPAIEPSFNIIDIVVSDYEANGNQC